VYGRSLKELDPSIEVSSLACPAIVPLVEEGFSDTEIMELTIKHYMDDFVRENDFDNLILGCTHYPLVAGHIKKLYPGIRLYSSSAEVISEARRMLVERDMLSDGFSMKDRYYASDLSDNFIAMTDQLFAGTDFKIKFVKLED
jgi:glutamate racemase